MLTIRYSFTVSMTTPKTKTKTSAESVTIKRYQISHSYCMKQDQNITWLNSELTFTKYEEKKKSKTSMQTLGLRVSHDPLLNQDFGKLTQGLQSSKTHKNSSSQKWLLSNLPWFLLFCVFVCINLAFFTSSSLCFSTALLASRAASNSFISRSSASRSQQNILIKGNLQRKKNFCSCKIKSFI